MSDKESNLATIGELYQTVVQADRWTTASLTRYTKDTQVIGRVFIEKKVAEDEIINPLLGVLNQMYVSLVLSALQLDQMVTKTKRVRDLIQLVSTEQWQDAADLIQKEFGVDRRQQLLAIMEEGIWKPGMQVKFPGETGYHEFSQEERQTPILTPAIEAEEDDKKDDKSKKYGAQGRVVALDQSNQKLISGRVLEVTFHAPTGQSIQANIMVQLVPQVLATDTASGFLQLNFSSSFWRRLKQVRAGEIRFFKDFILAFDQIEMHRKALQADKNGALARLLSRRQSNLFKYFRAVVGIDPENHNSANSILVVDQTTFDAACDQAGVNFNSVSDRNAFFRKSFTMMVVVVNPLYTNVTMYMNGIDAVANYSYKAITAGSSGDKKDFSLMEIMAAMNRNTAPRF